MRPVDRGPWPLDNNNQPKAFSSYGMARRDLIARMGQYCSYCETRLNASLAVEHVQPKALVPALLLDWTNFLLACTNCNSTKGDSHVTLTDYFWPDIHNTCIPFVYKGDGKIDRSPDLSAQEQSKAQAMLDLVGLQRYSNTATASDRRWINRKEAFEKAVRAKDNLALVTAQGPDVRSAFVALLADLATASGFFTVWLIVFREEHDVLSRLLNAFPGTHLPSFDANNGFAFLRRDGEM